MSSLPGHKLEDFLMWAYDLRVENLRDANPSLHIAEMLGLNTKRYAMPQAEFKPLVDIHEPHREYVEHLLEDFDEETQSWRGYAACIEFPADVDNAATKFMIDKGFWKSNETTAS